jgi:predicted ATP-grasp superfamily ATP-dependent carboligase
MDLQMPPFDVFDYFESFSAQYSIEALYQNDNEPLIQEVHTLKEILEG